MKITNLLIVLALLLPLANASYAFGWDNTTALYRQLFDVNYTKTDTIVDYQQFLNINTSSEYNSSLQYCNFIAAWHPAGQAAAVWVPTYIQNDTCNAVWWNTTVKVKLPSVSNTNGTIALYFGFPFDGTLTYANNSGNETFLLFDNGSVISGTSIIANDTNMAATFYPGRWNISTKGYGATNNATYANGEINVLKSTPNGERTKFSTSYNLTDDLRIDYKFRVTGTCSGDGLDGEYNILAGWGGYSDIGISSIDSPDSGVSASFGPGSGTDPHFLGNTVTGLFLKINNWSTTGVKVTNMWVNQTGKWPVTNGLKPQMAGLPNYVTFVVASENATMVYSQLNGTTYTNISDTNYCIDGTGGCGNASVWRLPFQGQYNGSLSPATQNMMGRILFDQRELCSGGTENIALDDIQISKFNANLSSTLIGVLEGQPAAGPTPTPTASNCNANDLLAGMECVAAPQFLDIFGDPIIVGITLLALAGGAIVFGSLGFQAGGTILFMLTYVMADEGYLPIPVYILMLLAVAYVLFALFMRLYRR